MDKKETMKINHILIFTIALLLIVSCTSTTPKEVTKEVPVINNEPKLALAPAEWIETRTTKAATKLNESPAGQLLWASIEAHGGLANWFAKGPISFQFDYQPKEGGTRRNSYQVVDQWSVRAVHEVADNRTMKYGWDGSQGWSYPDSADVGVNPRFWSTTPFYFIGLPFVLADDGVILEKYGQKEFNGVTFDLIKASYESGTGDASDYYVIYINPETKLMGGLRYIVSYKGFFPEGGHSPEKFMEIVGLQNIDGISLPTAYKTHWFKEDQVGEHITSIEVNEVSFLPETKDDFFTIPKGAKIQEGY